MTTDEADDGRDVRPDGAPVPGVRPAIESFDELFRAEQVAMVRLAYLLVGDEAVAEEVVQDALLTVYERWGRIHNRGGFLRQCVVNRSRRVLRRRKLEHRHRPRTPDAVEPAGRELLDALAALPYQWRAVVVLRFYGGLTQEEIADALDLRIGTVKSSLHRGLAQLRTVVKP
jgi:RNA polymerase sigma-70 factor (sigma-E family)